MHVEYKQRLKLLADRGISIAERRNGKGLSACIFTRIRRSEPATLGAAKYPASRLDDSCACIGRASSGEVR